MSWTQWKAEWAFWVRGQIVPESQYHQSKRIELMRIARERGWIN